MPLLLIFLLTTSFLSAVDSFRFEVKTIAEDFSRPMGMDLGPDGSIYLIELQGEVSRIHPTTGERITLAEIKVFGEQENGLLGIALDPNFRENNHLFLLYSPADFIGQRISRFTIKKETLINEKKVIEWKTQRRECCHHGGMLKFGPNGLLFASAGDNTHPFGDSASYAPIDRRPNREPWNAEKSSANPNDLRGGLIRIKVHPDASYTIPEGNLFPPGTKGTRPEIYVMGCRNPWKFSIDPKSGHLYWGEVGPDAGKDGPRGPRGHDEINQARKAGFFGWPYFIADNKPYSRVDFTNGKVGQKFNVQKPINDSPLNTGRKDLPPPQPALIFYPYADSKEFPELKKGGRTACAGPVFHYNPKFEKTGGFPKEFDHCLLFWDWHRPFIKWGRLDENEDLIGIENFSIPAKIKRPSDALFTPDGTLWFIDYGATWGNNKDAKLLHISYRHGNLDPVAKFTINKKSGPLPLKIKVDGSVSNDPEGTSLKFAWLKNGKPISTDPITTLIFTEPGDHPITLKVTDAQGASNEFTQYVSAGNSPPKLTFESPLDGSFFTPGKPLKYRLAVQDNEEGNSMLKPNSFASTVVTLAPLAKVSPGLSAIRASDCFNCHHATQKLIGPSFNDIAKRYKGDPAAFDVSVERVIKGSSKAWGEIPMLPHPNLQRNQVASMVRWIYSLSEKNTPQVSRGVEGKIKPSSTNQSLELSANFTDFGAYEGKATPLSGSTSIRLHPHTIEAETFSSHKGPQILDGEGLKFVGAINHSHWIEYPGFRIKDCKNLTVRYASGGAGAEILITANGNKVASAEIKPTGDWKKWEELTIPLINLPEGLVDLRLTFTNPGKQHLLNLDWFHFE
ncbi:MAG TPA: glycosyl hydrolase [Verrucomicrobiales bacterium]|nr:glycosyl hydrolase [Verrucomicrobiales bacterium]